MTSIPFETPPGDVDPRRASPCFHYPLATIKCVGSPIFRTQDARDFACLLDVDPDVASWSCDGVELSYGGETYLTDFVVTGVDGRTFVVDVSRSSEIAGLDRAGRRAGRIRLPSHRHEGIHRRLPATQC